jgi:hypothetical protein
MGFAKWLPLPCARLFRIMKYIDEYLSKTCM